MIARFRYTPLDFKRPAGTSRGVLLQKHSWIIEIEKDGIVGLGECSIIPGLSPDYQSNEQYEQKLEEVVNAICSEVLHEKNAAIVLKDFPSLLFGVECAFLDLKNGGKQIYFQNDFSAGTKKIDINGLIWMGDEAFMKAQIEDKLAQGFTTIKMKIGAIQFDTEIQLLTSIRTNFPKEQITLRVDANGAFTLDEAKVKLAQLAALDIHSIEQPIKAGQWLQMADLCKETPLPIALDEELIGINDYIKKQELLQTIKPQYIILKPSLHGGIAGTREWIELAQHQNIDWWMTSALESNIGLKAICDFTAEYDTSLPQGLGTGGLYITNFESKLTVEQGKIFWKQ